LQKRQVPPSSLVRVDTGSIPDGLVQLTMFEENLVAYDRVMRFVYVARPNQDYRQGRFKGHVIAFPSAGPAALHTCLIAMEDVPTRMAAVFIMTRGADTDMAAVVKDAKMFDVRGKEVAKWAVHLAKVRGGVGP
jgi:hypothetical protein